MRVKLQKKFLFIALLLLFITPCYSQGIDANTVLMLHNDGADQSTNIIDSSITPHTMTAVLNAQLDTGEQKFGTASLEEDGSGDEVTAPDSPDWDIISSSDFTIDLWWKQRQDIITTRAMILQNGVGGYYEFYFDAGNVINFITSADGVIITKAYTETSAWQHIAIDKYGTLWTIFVDGTSIGTVTHDPTPLTIAGLMEIGGNAGAATQTLDGWVDELRISKGISRYEGNDFTPPTAPYSEGAVGQIIVTTIH